MICTGDGCLEILISLVFFYIHFRYVNNIYRPKHLVCCMELSGNGADMPRHVREFVVHV